MKYQILSTKKLEPDIIQLAHNYNIHIIEKEFIQIHIIEEENKIKEVIGLLDEETPLVFTSSNAVYAIKSFLRKTFNLENYKFYCLAGNTKTALLDIVPEINIVGIAENATMLAQKIINSQFRKVNFPCGSHRRDELPGILNKSGINVNEIIVYKTIETPVKIEESFHAILFFSPSSVHSFFSLNKLSNETVCFTIGQTTARAVSKYATNKTIISDFPNQKYIIEKAMSYFQILNK